MSVGTELLVLALLSFAQLQAAEKPDFTGTWRLEGTDTGSSITIKQSDETIELSAGAQSEMVPQVRCNTMGRECEAKVAGEPAKVTYYFNGPMLVEMIYAGKNGNRVTKTRRALSPDGTRMTVEVMPMAPAGKSSTLVYVRQQPATSTQSAADPQP